MNELEILNIVTVAETTVKNGYKHESSNNVIRTINFAKDNGQAYCVIHNTINNFLKTELINNGYKVEQIFYTFNLKFITVISWIHYIH